MFTIVRISLIVLLVFSFSAVATAQEVSSEEQALLDRVLASQTALQESDTFLLSKDHDSTTLIVFSGGMTGTIETTDQFHLESHFIQGDTPNIQAVLDYVIESSASVDRTEVLEIRVVDGVLYLSGTREITEDDQDDPATLYALEDGWMEIANVVDWPGAMDLPVEDFVQTEHGWVFFNAESTWFTDPTSVTSETTTLEDGTSAEVITITLSSVTNEVDPTTNCTTVDDTQSQMKVTLGENDALLKIETLEDWTLHIVCGVAPFSTTSDIVLHAEETSLISDVNATFEPAEAPEL